MDPKGLVASISINVLSNFLSDLLKGLGGSRPSPIEAAIATTVEKFPGIEGLSVTLGQWLQSPGVHSAVEEYAKGLKGRDPVSVDALSRILLQNTQFFLPEDGQEAAHEIVAQFFSEIREQYLSIPELGIPHIANRLEEGIGISAAGFESLRSEVRGIARDSLDQQIDEARDRLQRHEHDMARGICEKLRQVSWDRLAARQRFRVLSNLATINLLQRKLDEAAALFVEAKRLQPEDPAAVANEALAYFLLGDNERAFELAAAARKRFPTSARALMVWLETAPATLATEDLEAAVPPHLGEDAEVIMAMARRSMAARDWPKAEELARQATAIKEDWSYPWSLLGEIIFRSELPDNAEDYARAAPLRDASRLEAVVDACTKASQLAQRERLPDVEAGALLIRAEARRLLGEADAEEDIVTAYSLRPDEPAVLRDYAYMKLRRGQKRDAIEKLRPVLKRHDRVDLRMVLAAALSGTGERQDRDEATQIFASMVADQRNVPAEFRTHAAVSAIESLVRDQHWDQAREFISQLHTDSLPVTVLAALRAEVELARGDRGKASELASDALASITASTTAHDIRLTGKLLEKLGRHRDALPLWQRLASPTRLVYDTCRFIDCVVRLGEHRLLLNLCEQLRSNGVYDPQLIEAEAAIRGHYDIEGTISLLQEYLRQSPEDRAARLQLSVIGIQLGRQELVSSDPPSMPAPESTAPENWKTIVLVMRSGGHLWEALKWAYGVLRLNFEDVEAHRAYMAGLLPTYPKPEIPVPEVAGPGAAVAFTEEGATQIEWRVIEDEFEPDGGLDEIGPEHFIAQQLAGKRVGDTFLVAQGSVVSKRATVLHILSKYDFRFQDCGENWLRRFPNQPDIQSVRVAVTRPGGEPGFDFTEFFQSFDRLLAGQYEVIEAYRNGPITIHILADALGRSDLEQTVSLAGDDSLSVRCCIGSVDERTGAILSLKNASGIVLDITAIATLALLDAIDLLPQLPTRLFVAEQTLSQIRWLAEDHDVERGRRGFGRDGHRYVITEMTPEVVRSQHEYLDSVVAKVRSNCAVIACPELAAVPNEEREFLSKAVGDHGAQSIVLASAPGNVLWTDDYGVALLAAHAFGVRRVWTQVALQEWAVAGSIKAESFIDATAKLLGWKYHFTSTGVPALARAGAIAGWNPDRWPLKGALEVFSDRAIFTKDVLSLAIGFMLQYVGEIVLPEIRDTVTVRVLDRLSSRGEGLVPIGALLRALPGAFGLNVLRATELIRTANAWLVTNPGIRRHA